MNKRSAKWYYTRFVNAMILIIVPATGSAVAAIPADVLSDKWKVLAGIAVSWLVATLKGLQYVIGETQEAK
ncbi:MAG: hypothetical protein KF872_05920 [Chitinophagales bacterium]|nr:hypothetical protein [Chitinophagales bacterium]